MPLLAFFPVDHTLEEMSRAKASVKPKCFVYIPAEKNSYQHTGEMPSQCMFAVLALCRSSRIQMSLFEFGSDMTKAGESEKDQSLGDASGPGFT